MSTLTGKLCRWARAATASVMVVGSAGCESESTGIRAPTATNHVLRVQGNGAGSGTVMAPDASPQLSCAITGGAVSGVCAMAYPSNSAVRLVATPGGASTFSGWSGACTGADQCVVDMAREQTVTAAFSAQQAGRSR